VKGDTVQRDNEAAMDPNAMLDELRQIFGLADIKQIDVDIERAAKLFSVLDDWVTRGGFLPNAWSAGEGWERKTHPTVNGLAD
jgi:hypothetical protein